jgi:DNA-binding NtrC family response regulator
MNVKERESRVGDVADEAIAARCRLPLLITADTDDGVCRIARRVHDSCNGSRRPFLQLAASSLSDDIRRFGTDWNAIVRQCDGGTVLLTGVHATPVSIQDALAEKVEANLRAAGPHRVRVIAGTTVPLFDRVHEGTFSEVLFYRLNAIHLVVHE